MNELQLIIDYTLSNFDANPLVNTITEVEKDLIDTNKDTLFPLVNVEYITSTVDDDQVICKLSISALNQVDVYQKTTDSKLRKDTNHSDIRNETFSICQSFINSFRQYNENDIEILSRTDLTPVMGYVNGLAGHEFEIELTISNMGSSCQ